MQTERLTAHMEIIEWATARNGKPAIVTENGNETDKIKIDFSGFKEENVKEIGWDEWLDIFEENNLALQYQTELEKGRTSPFTKLVSRNNH